MKQNAIIQISSFLLLTGIMLSCGPREYPKIPLDQLEPKLKRTGSVIAKDILQSFKHANGANYLLDKDYTTPLVHARIKVNGRFYTESYSMIDLIVGKVNNYSLFQVVDKGLIKTMRYKLNTENENLKFVELKIDVNIDYQLADYYLYVSTNDGTLKRQNILPRAVK